MFRVSVSVDMLVRRRHQSVQEPTGNNTGNNIKIYEPQRKIQAFMVEHFFTNQISFLRICLDPILQIPVQEFIIYLSTPVC